MSVITNLELQKNNKSRINLFIDNEFFCGITAFSAQKMGLKVGDIIDVECTQKLIFESEFDYFFSKCVDYMSVGYKTEWQIENFLKRKEVDAQVVECVINKLKEYCYIDDDYYCKAYVSQYKSLKSQMAICLDLKKKGICQMLIQKYLFDEANAVEELEVCNTVLEKYMRNREFNFQNKNKAVRYLFSKGFKWASIQCVLEKAFK